MNSASFGQVLNSTGEPACASCRIELVRLFSVAEVAPGLAVEPATPAIADGRGRIFMLSQGGLSGLIVLDSAGRLLSRFGRNGQGPGEFGGRSQKVLIGRSDSIFVCGARICQVFSPTTFEYVRVFSLPTAGTAPYAASLLADGTLGWHMAVSGLGRSEYLVHVTDQDGEIIRSIGQVQTPLPTCPICHRISGFGVTADRAAFWVASPGRYALRRIGLDGSVTKEIRVSGSPWYREWNPASGNGDLQAWIQYMFEGGDGVLWLYASGIASPSYVPRAVPPDRITAREAGAARGAPRLSRRIEAIDTRDGRILASLESIPVNISTFGGQLITSRRDSSDLFTYTDVWRLRLVGRR